jgi:2-polyprenyl-3-methyl-5-hydroxy-6-metoxy-1,4-benzoquinol methylase
MTAEQPMSTQQEFWSAYYRDVFQQGQRWLDYSNERVQSQTFGFVLEAAGPIRGRRCLDVGCGWGQLACALKDLGAAEVTAVDVVPEPIAQLTEQYPEIHWLTGDLSHDDLGLAPATVDVALLVEVLQYMPLGTALRRAWSLVAPGGRLVAVVPNAKCPIVNGTRQRFDSRYAPPALEQLAHELDALEGLEHWACRGLAFTEDQRIAPYAATPWTRQGLWPQQPNRLQIIAIKVK